jgi:8-hydroxy-5-deazaflavin:NADPH oxidoreductase
MEIAIIGTGNFGSALARACVAAGHTVVLSARHPEHAQKVAAETGARAADHPRAAVRTADLVVLAVPATATAPVVEDLDEDLAGRAVVDPTNPMNLPPEELLRASGPITDALRVLAPEARFVKAFNTVFASRLTDPVVDGLPLDGFYAGDDEPAKEMVAGLLADLGFRPLDAGPLAAARTLELMAFLNITLNASHGWPWRSGWKLVGSTG